MSRFFCRHLSTLPERYLTGTELILEPEQNHLQLVLQVSNG